MHKFPFLLILRGFLIRVLLRNYRIGNARDCGWLFFFLRKYHINHVIIKIGRTSAPGTNSTNDAIPIQRKMAMQIKIPTISNISPTTGIVNTTAAYSMISNITHNTSEKSSISVKTKYWGTRTLLVVF